MKDIVRGLNVYLIGMMGAGKTTVGELLAQKLEYRFLDTDKTIETVTSRSINALFAQIGEESFRDIETTVLNQVSAYLRTVISTGGGIILRQGNWSYLQNGMVIYLDVPIELLVKRLTDDRTRPLLQSEDLTAKLTQLERERKALYHQADIIITVSENDTVEDIVEEIIARIPTKIKKPFDPESIAINN